MGEKSAGRKSLSQFTALLRSELEEIARHESLNLDKTENRGYAFAIWAAELLMARDAGLEEDPGDVVLRGGSDLGVDAVLTDDASRTIILVQAKDHGTGRKAKPIAPNELKAFIGIHSRLKESAYIETGTQAARELLSSYPDRVKEGWKARFYFMTTASASDQTHQLIERENALLEKGEDDVAYELYDRSRLRDTYVEIESLDASIPDRVELDLPSKYFVEKQGPMRCLVAIMKGNSLVDLYNQKGNKEALFAWNIRNYLGDRGINRQIKETAQKDPGVFFYYNNGITGVCRDYTLTDNHLVIHKFQIINGAQTVASLANARKSQDIEVLFRLIQTEKTETESGINHDIIRANNTQNAIRLSDFRSNDAIQKFLKKAIGEQPSSETLGKVTYQPKRTNKRGGPRKLKLEELAKIRYAYLYDPLLVHSSPKSLWTPRSDGGSYEKAFGVEGEILDVWSKDVIEETLLAIAIHDAAEQAARDEKKRDPKQDYFKRLRFHALALSKFYVRSDNCVSVHSLLGSRAKFEEVWHIVWGCARRHLHSSYMSKVRDPENPMTRFSFVRSEKVWTSLKDSFVFDLRLSCDREVRG